MKVLKARDIELFKNLSQYEYFDKWIDFHNNYDCVKIILKNNGFLSLWFKGIEEGDIIKLKFMDVQIKKIEFFNINTAENLTIDNMYRGKVIREEKLLEFNAEGSGYFYVEFEEGQKIEFWSNGVVVDA